MIELLAWIVGCLPLSRRTIDRREYEIRAEMLEREKQLYHRLHAELRHEKLWNTIRSNICPRIYRLEQEVRPLKYEENQWEKKLRQHDELINSVFNSMKAKPMPKCKGCNMPKKSCKCSK